MALPSGTNTRAAIGRAAGTAAYGVAASAITNQIPILSEAINNTPIHDREESVIGEAGTQDVNVVGFDVAGPFSTSAWFEGLEYLIHAAMGFECPTVYSGVYGSGSGGSPAPDKSSSPGGFVHVFELDDNLHQESWLAGERAVSSGSSGDATYWTAADKKKRSFDLGVDKQIPAGLIHGSIGAMINKMSLVVTPGKVSFDWDIIAQKHDRSGAMNESNWVLPSERSRALFSGLEFRVGAVGSTLATTYPVQELNIDLENGLEAPHLADENGSGRYIAEPIRGDLRSVKGRVKLGRFTDETWQDWKDDEDDIQIHVVFTGPSIDGSSYDNKLQIVLPKCRVIKADFPTGGPGVYTGDIEFEALKPDSEQAWLTTLLGGVTQVKDNEMLVLLTNSQAACFSRDNQVSGVSLP